jgi:hypothetical protein
VISISIIIRERFFGVPIGKAEVDSVPVELPLSTLPTCNAVSLGVNGGGILLGATILEVTVGL